MADSIPVHGINHIALRVTDFSRSREFYVGTLGFSVVMEGAGSCIVNTGGTNLGLLGPSEDPSDRFSPFRVGLDHLALTVVSLSDLDAIKQKLDAAGVRNNGIESDPDVGTTQITFYDPDDIAWEAFFHPSFSAG